jgi:hypothetical protein
MPSARSKAFFASFLWPSGQKGWRLAGRDPPVLLGFYKNREQQINYLLLSVYKRDSKMLNFERPQLLLTAFETENCRAPPGQYPPELARRSVRR